jgi:hypothetical protein
MAETSVAQRTVMIYSEYPLYRRLAATLKEVGNPPSGDEGATGSCSRVNPIPVELLRVARHVGNSGSGGLVHAYSLATM